MPFRKWAGSAGYVFHAMNRAAGGWQPFATDDDCAAFLRVMQEGLAEVPIRILAYAVMPNHWHLVLWPRTDEEISEYLQWTTMTHALRWHKAHGTAGRGALYQGRFKAFPVQADDHFYMVCRYVERNPLRAGLVKRAEDYRWTSLWQRRQERADLTLSSWPLPLSGEWTNFVNQPQSERELELVRKSIRYDLPLGHGEWNEVAAARLNLRTETRGRGRPRRPE